MRTLIPLLTVLTLGCRGPDDTGLYPHLIDADGDGAGADVDCNDADAAVFPGAIESCNGIDDDCDGDTDDNASDATSWYGDADGDGYGSGTAQVACDAPAGAISDNTDCNDADAAFHPGATEDDCADNSDYNCDGSVGYADADGDGTAACNDCDDTSAVIYPGAVESCNDTDDNCDGAIDELGATGGLTWYADTDGDGLGDDDSRLSSCEQPTGYVSNTDDCDDSSSAVGGPSTWYPDGDGDGFGSVAGALVDCAQPINHVSSADDCDDSNAATYPGATTVCDGEDNDCDGSIASTEADDDNDGFRQCDNDCDDNASETHPFAAEYCNGVDNDCDGTPDNDALNATTYWADVDDDGFGDPADSQHVCSRPSGYIDDNALDCNDGEALAYPGAVEIWYDDIDQACDGGDDHDQDGDGDPAASGGGTDQNDLDPTCTTACSDGSGPGSPALTCDSLLAEYPGTGDGAYWLDPDGTGSYEAMCDMTSGGGGWTLILKTDQGSTAFEYSAAYWSDDTTLLNETDVSLTIGDAKYQSMNNLPFGEVMGCADTHNAGVTNCMVQDSGSLYNNSIELFDGPTVHILPSPDPGVDAALAAALRDDFYSVFGPSASGMQSNGTCLPQGLSFNLQNNDSNWHRWGFENNLRSQGCQQTLPEDADASIGWGLNGQFGTTLSAGFNEYFDNYQGSGVPTAQQRPATWLWVR